MRLAAAGASVRRIAEIISQSGVECSPSTVQSDLKAVIKAMKLETEEATQVMRGVQKERIDRLTATLMEGALAPMPPPRFDESGNLIISGAFLKRQHGAVDRLVKLMEREARLFGYDAPQKQELTGAGGAPLLSEANIIAVLAGLSDGQLARIAEGNVITSYADNDEGAEERVEQ